MLLGADASSLTASDNPPSPANGYKPHFPTMNTAAAHSPQQFGFGKHTASFAMDTPNAGHFSSFALAHGSAGAPDDGEHYDVLWRGLLECHFKETYAKEYLASFTHHCLDLQTFAQLSNEDLAVAGVRLGHRKKLRKIVADAAAIADKKRHMSAISGSKRRLHSEVSDAAKDSAEYAPLDEDLRRTKDFLLASESVGRGGHNPAVRLSPNNVPPHDSLSLSHGAVPHDAEAAAPPNLGQVPEYPAPLVDPNVECSKDLPPASLEALQQFMEDDQELPNSKKFVTKDTDVTWLRVSGQWESLPLFLTDMCTFREDNGFPASFDRLFFDNKPMPFVELSDSLSSAGILLRIPDLNDEEGSSIATITNRVVIIVNFDENFILTYHNCQTNPLELLEEEFVTGRYDDKPVASIVDSIMRKSLRAYTIGTAMMRDEMDEIVDSSHFTDIERVQGLTQIQKKSGVYKRCAEATRPAIEELEGIEVFRPYVKTLVDGLGSVESQAEEVHNNALSSIDLTIALSEFKSNANLKMFTYMTILLQPVALATSWYGMNFVNLPEIADENGYFIFAPAVWCASGVIFVLVVYGSTIADYLYHCFMPKKKKFEGGVAPGLNTSATIADSSAGKRRQGRAESVLVHQALADKKERSTCQSQTLAPAPSSNENSRNEQDESGTDATEKAGIGRNASIVQIIVDNPLKRKKDGPASRKSSGVSSLHGTVESCEYVLGYSVMMPSGDYKKNDHVPHSSGERRHSDGEDEIMPFDEGE